LVVTFGIQKCSAHHFAIAQMLNLKLTPVTKKKKKKKKKKVGANDASTGRNRKGKSDEKKTSAYIW
jgi:hypothetical protein